MEPTNDSLESIVQRIANAAVIGIVSHRRPDGDAIGSCLALAEALEAAGKKTYIVNEDAVPAGLRFLPSSERVQVAAALLTPIAVDLVVALDAAGKDRVGDAVWSAFETAGPVINIDHHVSNTRFGDINHIDDKSPATGEIVYELIRTAGWTVTPAARDSIYAAISTDTGSFRYPSATGRTYRIAADLIDAGSDVGKISQQLYESYPLRRLLLLRDMLQDMEILADGRVVAAKLTLSMMESVGMAPGDSEGLIDVIRSVDTVIVAVIFEEMADGKIRVSSRSKTPAVDVGAICGVFGGGGHTLAAGARMKGPIDEAAKRFLTEVEERLDGHN